MGCGIDGQRGHDLPALASANATALGSEAIVVAHDELRFDLIDGIHGNADDDEQRGAAEVEVDAETLGHPGGKAVKDAAHEEEVVEVDSADEELRNDGDDDEIEGADQRDAGEHVVDEVGGALAGADAGDEATVLAHVVGDVVGTEDDGDVEVGEEDDGGEVKDDVPRFAGCDVAEDGTEEGGVGELGAAE